MASTADNQTPASAGEPWLTLIEEDESDDESASLHNEFIYILNKLLLSKAETTAADAALRVDRVYEETFLPNDPLLRFEEDRGMGPYLTVLWHALIDVVELVPHDDPKQDKLVQFVLEMRKIPSKSFTIFGKGKTFKYIDDPTFECVQEHRWNGDCPADIHRNGRSPEEYQSLCDAWVNYSTFTARCIVAGIDGFYRTKHSSLEIKNGLEAQLDTQPERDCKVMVAAQYILIAGPILRGLFIDEPRWAGNESKLAWGLEHWPMWIDRLKGIEEKGDCAPKVLAAVAEAREELIALHPPDAELETTQTAEDTGC